MDMNQQLYNWLLSQRTTAPPAYMYVKLYLDCFGSLCHSSEARYSCEVCAFEHIGTETVGYHAFFYTYRDFCFTGDLTTFYTMSFDIVCCWLATRIRNLQREVPSDI